MLIYTPYTIIYHSEIGLMFTNWAIKQGPTYGYTLYLVHPSFKWIHPTYEPPSTIKPGTWEYNCSKYMFSRLNHSIPSLPWYYIYYIYMLYLFYIMCLAIWIYLQHVAQPRRTGSDVSKVRRALWAAPRSTWWTSPVASWPAGMNLKRPETQGEEMLERCVYQLILYDIIYIYVYISYTYTYVYIYIMYIYIYLYLYINTLYIYVYVYMHHIFFNISYILHDLHIYILCLILYITITI